MSLHDALLAKAFGGGNGGNGGANIDVTASVGQTIVVEEVDADGKPTKWKAAEFQERTHWSEETVGDIVPHTAFTPYLNEKIGCTMHPLVPFELEEGKSYTVIFDGVEYACTAMTFSMPADNMEGLFIGNPVFAGGGNNGMPFGVTCFDNQLTVTNSGGVTTVLCTLKWYMVLCMDTEQHTVQVVGEKREYHKIPEEYVSGDFLVHFSRNSIDTSWVMTTPWEAIIEAVKARRNIRGVFCEESYSFDQYGDLHKEFVYKNLLCLDTNVGREGNTVCTLLFLGLLSNTGGITVKVHRDENGVTTVEEGW